MLIDQQIQTVGIVTDWAHVNCFGTDATSTAPSSPTATSTPASVESSTTTSKPSTTIPDHSASTLANSTRSTTSTSVVPSSTLSCQQPRLSGAPSGASLQDGLNVNNAIQNICQTSFTPTNRSSITYTSGFMDITIIREDINQPLQWCTPGLNAIISSCIVKQDFFGGVYTQGNEVYNISNSGYPGNENPLSIALPSSTTTSAPTSTSESIPSRSTVTTSGMVCVLIEGSTDPQCTPQSTPTPNVAGTNVVGSLE
jgi:hypothetical protein